MLLLILALVGCSRPLAPRVAIRPDSIYASGSDTATLIVESAERPVIKPSDARFRIRVGDLRSVEGRWQATLRAGTFPGVTSIRVDDVEVPFTLKADRSDRDEDGLPDVLHLDTSQDREAFLRWFTFLAETQFYRAELPAEIDDCAALIRYSYREALRTHDPGWVRAAGLPIILGLDNVEKYAYPHTLVGPSLFRVDDTSWGQFADARTLMRLNTRFISKDMAKAVPGDLLFFRQENHSLPYHSMIYVGASQIKDDGRNYVLYHTGPTGSDPGEIRRPSFAELMNHENPQWRPTTANPAFLGVYRWNIVY